MNKVAIHGLWEHNPWMRCLMSGLAILPANTWTAFRALGIIIFIPTLNYGPYVAGLVFAFLLLTDFIDGKVARLHKSYSQHWLDPLWYLWRLGLISRQNWEKSGIWFDPMADKIFILSYFYYLGIVQSNLLPLWFWLSLAIIELSGRAVIIPIARSLLCKSIILPANFWGKAKFVAEAILAVLIFLAYYLQQCDFSAVILALCVITLAMAVFSVVNYIFEFHDPWRKR